MFGPGSTDNIGTMGRIHVTSIKDTKHVEVPILAGGVEEGEDKYRMERGRNVVSRGYVLHPASPGHCLDNPELHGGDRGVSVLAQNEYDVVPLFDCLASVAASVRFWCPGSGVPHPDPGRDNQSDTAWGLHLAGWRRRITQH